MGVNRADFKVTRGGRNSSELSTNLFHMPGDVLRCSGMLQGAPKWLGNLDSRQFLSKKQTSFFVLEYVIIEPSRCPPSIIDPYVDCFLFGIWKFREAIRVGRLPPPERAAKGLGISLKGDARLLRKAVKKSFFHGILFHFR